MEETGDLAVVYVYFGPIHTKEALSNPDLITKINQIGGTFVDELYKDLTAKRFMSFSRKFTDHIGLATPRIKRLFQHMDNRHHTFTMANFGEVAFSVQQREKAEDAVELLNEYGVNPVLCSIDEHGAILLQS
jgi:pantoate kinase